MVMERIETIAVAINGSQENNKKVKSLHKFEPAVLCKVKEEEKNVQKSPEDNSSSNRNFIHLDMM